MFKIIWTKLHQRKNYTLHVLKTLILSSVPPLPYIFRWYRDSLLSCSSMSETSQFLDQPKFWEGTSWCTKIASASELRAIPRTPQLLHHNIFCLKYMCVCVCLVVSDSATSWAVAPHTPVSMGFSMQEYWSGLSCSSP